MRQRELELLLGVHVVVHEAIPVVHLRVDGGDQDGVHRAEVLAGHREERVDDLQRLPRLVGGVRHRPRALEPVLEVLVRVSDRVTQDVDVAHGYRPDSMVRRGAAAIKVAESTEHPATCRMMAA